MKNIKSRLLCTLLTLCMLLSLCSGVYAAPSSVDIVTTPAGYATAEDVVYKTEGDYLLNWGARGEDCLFLSTYAQDFYAGSYTYEKLEQLEGGATTAATPDSELYDALQNLMVENHTYFTHYGGSKANACKNFYYITDCMLGNTATVSTIYRGDTVSSTWNGSTYNQEHVWPNSKCIGDDTTDVGDIMHLRPAIPSENSARGNKAYGESGGTIYYDPGVSVRGDCARTVLYMYVRWGNTGNMWGGEGVMESLDVLLRWIKEDPVDTWEMGRNDSVQSITGTRNVFVDYPELAFLLFGQDVPKMTTPSGIADAAQHTITVQANNAAWGTVAVSGKTITASPKAGYQVDGYTVVSGNATLTRKGNTFTVEATEDCVITINFAERQSAWVLFMENGSATGSPDVYVGDTFTMPESFVQVPEGFTFQGWVTRTLAETTEKPATIYKPGQSVVAEGDVIYYALYARLDAQGGGSSTTYTLHSGALDAGKYLIVYNDGNDDSAMAAEVSDKGRMNMLVVHPVNDAIDNPDDSIIWELSYTDDGYITLYNAAGKSYVAGTGAKSKAKLLSSVTDFAKWSAEGDGPYTLTNLGNGNAGVNNYLRRNGTYGFACYASGTGGDLSLYKQSGGTVYYSTIASVCEHKNVYEEQGSQPTCTQDGFTDGVFCADCKSYISGHALIPAPGHAYEAVKVVQPTETTSGYTTFTCTVCGDTYSGDFTPPTGKQYTVTFAVPEGVEPVESVKGGKNGIDLPTAGDVEGYTFVGWVEAQTQDTTTAPTVYKTTYTVEKEVTLYALYSYTTGGTGEVGWHLVTDADDLAAGDQLVMAQSAQGVVATELSGKFLEEVAATFSEDGTRITNLPATAVTFTLGGTPKGWTLTYSGKQLGATAVKTVAWDNGTCTWTIAVDENSGATIQNTEATFGRFLYNVQYTRFCTYTSDTNSGMLLPQLYKLSGSLGTTYYTTLNSQIPNQEPATLSGTITSSDAVEGDVTVELWSNGVKEATVTTTDGTYTFENLLGSYTLKVSKANHVTREYTVTVNAKDVTLDGEICLLGDVNADGQVDVADVGQLYSWVKTNQFPNGYTLSCANVNGGDLDIADVGLVYAHVKQSKPLW